MPIRARRHLLSFYEHAVSWLGLIILLFYSYAFLVRAPYTGFHWQPDGRVFEIYVPATAGATLRENDYLVQIGPLSWTEFQSNLRRRLFDGVQPGERVTLLIQRDGEIVTIPWRFPGFNRNQLLARLGSQWWLGYVFWLTGLAVLLFARPRDARWRLLIAFNFLTALWLVTGTVSAWRVWYSARVLRMALWLCIPVYWHLHWLFPAPLGHVRTVVWGVIYGLGIGLAGAEWFRLLPRDLFFLGFVFAAGGSWLLLAIHFLFQREQRRDILLLVLLALVAFLPAVAFGVAGTFSTISTLAGGALLALPAVPLSYLFVAYRRQLGGLELRANRLVSLYLFLILLGTVF
ncbi:MAG: hypothetical protein ACREQ3_27480, partial [Candidatus Binatia bacterium]